MVFFSWKRKHRRFSYLPSDEKVPCGRVAGPLCASSADRGVALWRKLVEGAEGELASVIKNGAIRSPKKGNEYAFVTFFRGFVKL